jgi:dihydrofolate reductase
MAITLTIGPVARARNGVIGKDGHLPWKMKTDMRLFTELTLGKPVIMGRKTWDSLFKKPLPGRMNVVLSRDGSFEPKGALVCESLDDAIRIAREHAAEDEVEEVCVIGGVGVFEAALPRARRIYLSEVDADAEGDAHFPDFDESQWLEVRRETHPAGEGDDHAFTFRVLERR